MLVRWASPWSGHIKSECSKSTWSMREVGGEISSSTSFIQMDEILSSIDKFLIHFFLFDWRRKNYRIIFYLLFDWWMLYVTSTEINIEKKKSNSSFRDEKFPCFRGWRKKKQIHLILVLCNITRDLLFHFSPTPTKRGIYFSI